jgi:hypothetical protein
MVTLNETNASIIHHVGLYRVVTRTTVATVLPEGSEPDKRLGKLAKDGLLRVHKGLAGNRSVYQLTKKGAGVANVSPARGRVIGAQSLLKNLGVLLFCHVPGMNRHRVEADELGKAMATELPDGAYCLCQIRGITVIFDTYVPGGQTPIATILRHLKKQLRVAKKVPALAEAIKDLRYGFALIVPTKQRRKTIMDAVRTRGEDEKVPLIKRVRIWVEAIEELGAVCGTAMPRLGSVTGGTEQTLLWTDSQ